MGSAVFPLCCLTRGQTMVEVMKIMGMSFKRSVPTLLHSVPLALHQAATDPRLHQRLLHIHRQVWVRLFCGRRWCSRRTTTHLPWELQNYNSLLNNLQQEDVGSHQKNISHFQGQRRSPSKTVGGAKSHLESNPIPTRDAQRAQTKPCVHQDPEIPHRPECL